MQMQQQSMVRARLTAAILITTKKGKVGKMAFDVNFTYMAGLGNTQARDAQYTPIP